MSESHSTDFAVQLELAWAAGFFDGEGCTSLDIVQQGRLRYVRLSIKQVEFANLERFRAAVGGLGTLQEPRPENPGRMLRSIGVKGKPIGRWRSSGTDARKVLALLWPYLGGAKRAQAERALAGENNKGGVAPSLRTHCPKGHSYDGVRAGRIGRRCKRCDAERAREKRKTDKPHPKFRTHCPQGHDYATEGRVNSEGKRVCRICQRDARRRYEGRLKAAGEEHA